MVKQRTYAFPQNNYVWVDTCVKYIEKYGSNDLRATYKTVLEDQEIYRFFCIAEQTGVSTIGRDYLDMFGKFVGKKVEGCITDAVEEALKISLPDYLKLASDVSSVQKDAEELKALSEFVIDNCVKYVWVSFDYYRIDDPNCDGIPSVKDLANTVHDHATSTYTSWKSLRDDKTVELVDGIHTYPLG